MIPPFLRPENILPSQQHSQFRALLTFGKPDRLSPDSVSQWSLYPEIKPKPLSGLANMKWTPVPVEEAIGSEALSYSSPVEPATLMRS